MDDVEKFVDALDVPRKKIAIRLRTFIAKDFLMLAEIYSWKMPVYIYNGKKIIYIQKGKDGINLGFNSGSRLIESRNIFHGEGKIMRHIKITSQAEIDQEYFTNLIQQAIDLAQGTTA